MAIDKNEIKVFFIKVNEFHDDVSVFRIFFIEIFLCISKHLSGVFSDLIPKRFLCGRRRFEAPAFWPCQKLRTQTQND